MMEAARTSETSVDNYFTRQYIPEDNSEQASSWPQFRDVASPHLHEQQDGYFKQSGGMEADGTGSDP
jgi:hypothetical protein